MVFGQTLNYLAVSVKSWSWLTSFCLCRDKEQLDLLRQQMLESTKVAENLRKELSVYEKLYKLSYEGKNIEVQTDGMYVDKVDKTVWALGQSWNYFILILWFWFPLIVSFLTPCIVVFVYQSWQSFFSWPSKGKLNSRFSCLSCHSTTKQHDTSLGFECS